MEEPFLTPAQLADRWKIKVSTLAQWRWNGRGPYYSKPSGHVRYLVSDVKHYEESKRHRSTSEYPASQSTNSNPSGYLGENHLDKKT